MDSVSSQRCQSSFRQASKVTLTTCDTGREYGFTVYASLCTKRLSFIRLARNHVQNGRILRGKYGGEKALI